MKKLTFILLLFASILSLTACGSDSKVESAFKDYAKTENIPNFKGIKSIECTDTIPYEEIANIEETEHQIDSVKTLLLDKFSAMTDYVKTLSYAQGKKIVNKVALIGTKVGDIGLNSLNNNNESIGKLKNALEEVSPYKDTLYIYHIIAKVGDNDISYYGFSCGEDISFVKADRKEDAVSKNEKLMNVFNASMYIIETEIVPRSMLIDEINEIMNQ